MSEETVTAESTPNEKEKNIIEQMADYDFNVPVQVEVIFEDSDEDINVKQEVCDLTDDNNATDIVKQHDAVPSVTLNDSTSTKVEHNQDVQNSSSVNETNGILVDKQDTNNPKTPEIDVEELISQAIKRVKGIYNHSDDINDLKRKSDLEEPYRKIRKGSTLADKVITNNTSNNKTDSCQQNNQSSEGTSVLYKQLSVTDENNVNTPKCCDTNKGNIPESFSSRGVANPCILNLLKTVANGLIVIIKAHNIWRRAQDTASQKEIDAAQNQFLRIRNHFFHIAYSTVENIIIPQLENVDFVTKFMEEVVKLSCEMKQCVQFETQVKPIFYELVEWTKRKKVCYSNNTVISLLLQSPPGNTQGNTLNTSVDNSRSFYLQPRVAETSCIPIQNVAADPAESLSRSNNTAAGKSVVISCGAPENQISITVDQAYLHGNINANNTYGPYQKSNSIGHHYPPHVNANNVPRLFENPPPPPYPHTSIGSSWNNAFQQEVQANAYQQAQTARAYHQSAEVTRSRSTDSGFASPVHFNNTDPTNNGKGETPSRSATPVITHITSLNPEARYIKQGTCHVCGATTHTMCVGCYKKYYCSLGCQRADWKIHSGICRRT